MPYKPATQPETLGQLLSRSLELYRRSIIYVFFLALALSITAFIPRLMAVLIGQNIFANLPQYSPTKLWLMLIDLVCLIFFVALLWRIQCVTMTVRETFTHEITVAIKKLPLIIAAAFIQAFILALIIIPTHALYLFLHYQQLLQHPTRYVLFLLGLPLILSWLLYTFVFFLFYFYLPLILTENAGIFSSLKRSAQLVWGNWWLTFKMQITPWIIYLFVLIGIKYAAHINIHIYLFKVSSLSMTATLVHILVFALFVPWFASNLLVQLHDLEMRKNF